MIRWASLYLGNNLESFSYYNNNLWFYVNIIIEKFKLKDFQFYKDFIYLSKISNNIPKAYRFCRYI